MSLNSRVTTRVYVIATSSSVAQKHKPLRFGVMDMQQPASQYIATITREIRLKVCKTCSEISEDKHEGCAWKYNIAVTFVTYTAYLHQH